MTEPKNREHTGGGEQNRRKQQTGDPRIEKNPPRDRDGMQAGEGRRPARDDQNGEQNEQRER